MNFQDWLDLNKGGAEDMANNLVGGAERASQGAAERAAGMKSQAAASGQDVSKMRGYDTATDALTSAAAGNKLLGTASGQQAMLAKRYGYGGNAWDTAALGGVASGRIQALQDQWGGLAGMLSGPWRKTQAPQPAPVPAPQESAEDIARLKVADDNLALRAARKAGYSGDDADGARRWYRAMFGEDIPSYREINQR